MTFSLQSPQIYCVEGPEDSVTFCVPKVDVWELSVGGAYASRDMAVLRSEASSGTDTSRYGVTGRYRSRAEVLSIVMTKNSINRRADEHN